MMCGLLFFGFCIFLFVIWNFLKVIAQALPILTQHAISWLLSLMMTKLLLLIDHEEVPSAALGRIITF